jgi:MAP/microtubule affinity-regulating kinase
MLSLLSLFTSATEERYKRLEQLGVGTFSHVYLCEQKSTGNMVAMKKYRSSTGDMWKKEKDILVILQDCPKVPLVVEHFALNSTHVLVLEYIDGETLFDLLRRSTREVFMTGFTHYLYDRKITSFFKQLCEILAFAHDRNVLHRDIKAENIIVRGGSEIFVIDWGLSDVYKPEETYVATGSPDYAAPEVFDKPPRTGPENDIWSAGVCLVAMCTLLLPRLTDYDEEKIKSCLNVPSVFSDAKEALMKIFRAPDKRITARQLLELDWLKKV